MLTLECLYGIGFLATKTNVLPVLFMTLSTDMGSNRSTFLDFQNGTE